MFIVNVLNKKEEVIMMKYQLVSYMLRVRVDALKEKYVQALPFFSDC